MNFVKSLTLIGAIALVTSCGGKTNKKAPETTPATITQKVDEATKQLEDKISSYKKIATLDHHRMAEVAGVYTPPAIATIFSDTKTDIALVQQNQLIALDLPFKVLCYAEPDTLKAKVAFTSAEFIQKRHNLGASFLADYKSNMNRF